MGNRTRIYLLMVAWVLSLSGSVSRAQENKVVQDFCLWTGAKLEKSFHKDWSAFVAGEVRLKENMSRVNNFLTEAGLRYRINKNFALEGQYRITFDQKWDDYYATLSRYALDLRYRGRVHPLSIRYRLRYQKEIEGFEMWDMGLDYEKYLRNRISVRYEDLDRLAPYVSAELFQLFKPSQVPEYEYIRVLAGSKFDLPGGNEINLALGFNREFHGPDPATIYMLKLNYTFSF